MIEKELYSVFINKKEVQVPYIVFLCHCFKQFKTLQTLDTYTLLGTQTCLGEKANIINYLNTIYSFLRSENEKPKLFYRVRKLITVEHTKSSIIFLGLFYREFKYIFDKLSCNKKVKDYYEIRNLFQVFNKMINSPSIKTSDDYNKLQPWLNFYWKLAIVNKNNLITIDSIKEVISKIDPSISLEDIKTDLNNHLIILPYKDYYIWSCDSIYKWLTTESRSVIQSCIFNKRLSLSSIKLIEF